METIQPSIYRLTAPERLSGHVNLPPSKSISNRALIIRALSGGRQEVGNLSTCDDTQVMLRALTDESPSKDVESSGTSMRFLTAYLATLNGQFTIDGTDRMRQRPIGSLVDALRQCGAHIDYMGNEGYPPLSIKGGQLEGGTVSMKGNISSQFVSALLMIGPVMQRGLRLKLEGEIISRPYIDLTIEMMQEAGAQVNWVDHNNELRVEPRPYVPTSHMVESDWTAVSYWYELVTLMAATQPRLSFSHLQQKSMQGDAVVRYLYHMFGVKTTFRRLPDGTTLTDIEATPHKLDQLDFDFSNNPDLAQTVVCTCLGTGTHFRFTGLETLYIKETDRIAALISEARKLGFILESPAHGQLLWHGQQCTPTWQPIDTHQDHRMAMAFAPLAVKFPQLKISHPEVVGKSYPDFWKHLQQVGFTLNETI